MFYFNFKVYLNIINCFSGGIVLTVIGTNFHRVTEPKIVAYLPHNKNKTVSAVNKITVFDLPIYLILVNIY